VDGGGPARVTEYTPGEPAAWTWPDAYEEGEAMSDGKYGEISCTGKAFHPGEPVFLLRATDPFAAAVIREYADYCRQNGCDPDHVAAAGRHAARVEAWQRANPALVKPLPD
jgi:hypothetical protein